MKTFLPKSGLLTFVFLITNLFFALGAFAQATVTTDKLDYAPGEYVIITGTGWLPGETVSFHFDEDPKPLTCLLSHDIFAIADDEGNIYNEEFLIKINHLGVAFVLTATGESSKREAIAYFTDGAVTITAATGGNAISADNTGGTYTVLIGPIMAEAQKGDISISGQGCTGSGTKYITLQAPTGFEFDITGVAPTIALNGDGTNTKNINDWVHGSTNNSITSRTSTELRLDITKVSNGGSPNTLTWQNIRVRPAAGLIPASGNIMYTGNACFTTIQNGSTITNPNYGTLTMVPGALHHFNINTIGNQTSAVPFNVTITAKDLNNNTITSFNNTVAISSTIGTISPKTSGSFSSGVLIQSVTITGEGIGAIGVVGDTKTGNSNSFTVIVPCTAPAINTAPSNGQPTNQTITYGGSATFTVAASNTTGYQWQQGITSGGTTTWADINGFENTTAITTTLTLVKPTVSMSGYKYRCVVTGACTPNATSDGNATLIINKLLLTVGASSLTNTKTFDGNTTAVVTAGSLVNVVSPDAVSVSAAANYDNRNFGTNKQITVVYTLDGLGMANYDKPVDLVVTDGVINKLLLTVGAPSLTNTKTFDGNTTAVVTAGSLVNVVSPDAVSVSAAANYDNRNFGTNKQITVVYTLDGLGMANYDKPVDLVVTDGVINAKTLTITADNQSKVYDGLVYSPFTVSYVGFVSGENKSVLSGLLSFIGTAVSATEFGTYIITPQGLTSTNYNIRFVNGNLDITKASTESTLILSAPTLRYMDKLTMTAVIVPSNTATPLNGTVEFKIGSVVYGTAAVVPVPGAKDGSVQAMLIKQVAELPNTTAYTVIATFTSANANYSGSSNSKSLIVNQRKASPYTASGFYTGNTWAWTTSLTSSTATITMSTIIKDNTPAEIGSGDVRAAKVSFYLVNGTSMSPIPSAQNIPVGLIDVTDGSYGAAGAIVQLNIGSQDVGQFQIAVKVSGAYSNNEWAIVSQDIITIARPSAGGSIYGLSPKLTNTKSSGLIKGANGETTTASFDVTYNKKATNTQGKVTVMFSSYYNANGILDSELHNYIIKSNAITGLVIKNNTAEFSSKANLSEQLSDGTSVGLDSGAAFQLTLTDGGTSAQDKMGITMYRKDGGIWFSSNWNVTKTDEQSLFSGQISVNGLSTTTKSSVTATELVVIAKQIIPAPGLQQLAFNVIAYPNPSNDQFKLVIEGGSNEKVEVKVFDLLGRLVKVINKNDAQPTLFGEDLPAGSYMTVINQGIETKTVRLIKK
jgi:hypothetical protein